MAYEPKPDSGSLFKNEKREKDTHAQYRGEAVIDGVSYFMDAWVNETKATGKKYFSIKFKKKNKQAASSPRTTQSDDIPL